MTTAPTPTPTRLPALDPSWRSWAGLHGGYLLARATAAVGDGDRRVHSVHALVLGSAPAGVPLQLTTDALQRGRSSTVVRGTVTDGSRDYLELTVLAGAPGAGPAYRRDSAPSAPGPDTCPEFAFPRELVPFAEHLVVRPANAALPLAGGPEAELVAWVQVRDAGLSGSQRVLVLLDALPPALYATMTEPIAIPTLTMSSHLTTEASALRADAWCLVRIRTESAADGWATETSQVWSATGALLGTSVQERRLLT